MASRWRRAAAWRIAKPIHFINSFHQFISSELTPDSAPGSIDQTG
jgi:hypothetical protein